jgi:hypothetical protein
LFGFRDAGAKGRKSLDQSVETLNSLYFGIVVIAAIDSAAFTTVSAVLMRVKAIAGVRTLGEVNTPFSWMEVMALISIVAKRIIVAFHLTN